MNSADERTIRVAQPIRERRWELYTKRHEMVVFRNGVRVWEGPLFRIADEGSQVKLFAKDVLAYLEAQSLALDGFDRQRR